METSVTFELILIGVLILVNAFFAASEIAIISSRKGNIRKRAEDGDRSAQLVLGLFENSSRFLATIQVGITLVGFFASAIAAISSVKILGGLLALAPVDFIARSSSAIALIVVTLLVAFVTIVLGELVPKGLAIQHSDSIALFVARPIEFLARLVAPLITVLTASSDVVVFLLGGGRGKTHLPFVTEDEIRAYVDAGEEEGALESDEADMIYGILDLEKKRAHEIMVPRTDMVAIEMDAPLQEALELVVRHGYSRVPLFQDSLDNVTGILYAKDLLKHLASGQSQPSIKDLAKEPVFVPESKRVDELLQELLQRRVHMAIVVDEYGGTAGLVTIEDLLEEIVGEIQDEYDREEPQVQHVSEGEAILDGRVSIADLNELFDIEIPSDEFDTVGGLVIHQLGKMPSTGDSVSWDNLSLVIMATSGRRIKKVKVTTLPVEAEAVERSNGPSTK
ncbi:MAG: hemolysin family protein [Dehalococcoidia bacterium]|nr:hemolysin family protein [Dehalococcoidia bacterium]